MLTDLKIENFAIIDKLDISFSPGFNVLTGESGAGKSLIVDSLNFVLGERLKNERVETGKTVQVQARFELEEEQLPDFLVPLQESGIIDDNGRELIFTRKLQPSGKNLYHINGEMVPFKTYRSVCENLVDIHGQRDTHQLLNSSHQRTLLDLLGGEEAAKKLSEISEIYHKCRKIEHDLEELKARERERNREIDWVRFEVQEIDDAKLEPGEDDELERKKTLLENAERITEASSYIYENLSGENGVIDRMGRVAKELARWMRYDNEIEKVNILSESILEQVQEMSYICMEKGEAAEFSQDALDKAISRLHQIERLKGKYGITIEEIHKYRENMVKKLHSLEQSSELAESLQTELGGIYRAWFEKSMEMTNIRQKTALALESSIKAELLSLGFESVDFSVKITGTEGVSSDKAEKEEALRVTPWGLNEIEFHISLNAGVSVKSLSSVASGGELSRVMLALRNIFSRFRGFSTLVLDEIDMGLGGVSAAAVGKKLREITVHRQILCITHQATIAALANSHFLIKKQTCGNETKTDIMQAEGNDRVEEIMRMLAGMEATGETRSLAESLLKAG